MPKKCLLSRLKKKVKKKHNPIKWSYVTKQNNESGSSYASEDDGREVKKGNSTKRSMSPNPVHPRGLLPPTNILRVNVSCTRRWQS